MKTIEAVECDFCGTLLDKVADEYLVVHCIALCEHKSNFLPEKDLMVSTEPMVFCNFECLEKRIKG